MDIKPKEVGENPNTVYVSEIEVSYFLSDRCILLPFEYQFTC